MRKSRLHSKTTPVKSWIEVTFQKRECIRFIPNVKDELSRCCCGRTREQHKFLNEGQQQQSQASQTVLPGELWYPSRCTVNFPTDAYGILEFQGGPHPSKAQYIRVAHDTKPEHLMQLVTKEWNLELPKLLISIQGGKANFELPPKLKKVLRKGLLKAARSTNAWIFTGGTNTGVTKHVGDALLLERSQRTGRVNTLGIAPWGIVENNHELIGHNTEVPYHSISSPRSKFAALNNRHAYFLLVDNGTVGKYGAEIVLRRRLEKHISKQRLYPFTQSPIPIVCLVIEGGTHTIRAVLEYVTDEPPVPVVVCDGSGRAADLLAFMCKYENQVLRSMRNYIIATIQRAFEVPIELADGLYTELMQCVENKNLIKVFRIADKYDQKPQELDQTILTALFKSQHLSPTEQLSLALTWNRADIARFEIFVYGQEWPTGALEDAMMKALEHDRCDFVKLLLENGVSMRKFLTIPRLENLYNTNVGPSNTLHYILRDLRPHLPPGYVYTLHDIGLVINKLMGGAYRAFYTRRKFRPIYAKVMNKAGQNASLTNNTTSSYAKQYGNAMSLLAQTLPSSANPCLFDYPFNELLIWAVLMKRHKMALLMWQHGEEALAKALVGCKLYKAMAHEAAEDDLETEVYEELRNCGREFENTALEVLDYCYRQDDDQAQQLLTCELQNWSGQTCLSLAVAANHRAVLAHPCSQIILADLWMGGLRTRKNTNLKVMLGLLCPPYILTLEFKSKEELQLMPQTTEEHMELENEDDDKSESDKMTEGGVEKRTRSMSLRGRSSAMPQGGVKALLAENFNVAPMSSPPTTAPQTPPAQSGHLVDTMTTTLRQQNGDNSTCHVFITTTPTTTTSGTPTGHSWLLNKLKLQTSSSSTATKSRNLKISRRLREFYTAPITKFWANALAYLMFLICFSYTILVEMSPGKPTWQECVAITFLCTYGCEKVRELLSSEPVGFKQKVAVWSWNLWNPCDMAAVSLFLIGMCLRFRRDTFEVGRVIYCVNSIYWYLHILNILSVNKYLGPLVTMMGKMVKNMIYFVVLLLIVLMSFGVTRQAILYPHRVPSWTIVRDVFLEPYFMLYGEVYADKIDPPCGADTGIECQTGRWISPIIMSIYLLVANILLINLLIAVFNNIFNEVNSVAHQVWMFQRFTVVMEYEQKPLLPPPLIIFSHLYLLVKYVRRKMEGLELSYDNGLKLFLDRDEMEALYDFEEDCVEGYFAEQELRLQQSSDERIKLTTERIESLTQKVEDIHSKESMHTSVLQNLDVRCRKLAEQMQQVSGQVELMRPVSGGVVEGVPQLVQPSITTVFGDEYEYIDEESTSQQPQQQQQQKMMPSGDDDVARKAAIIKSLSEAYAATAAGIATGLSPDEGAVSKKGMRLRTHSSDSTTSNELSMDMSADDVAALSLDLLKTRAAQKRRDSATPRISECIIDEEDSTNASRRVGARKAGLLAYMQSEGGGDIIVGETPPLAQLPPLLRSVTFTDTKTVPLKIATSTPLAGDGINVSSAPAASHRTAMLMHMHTEFPSITDELESVCGLLVASPPHSPGLHLASPPSTSDDQAVSPSHDVGAAPSGTAADGDDHFPELSIPEQAINFEKQHLRHAEESDYLVLEDLIQRRRDYSGEVDDDVDSKDTTTNTWLHAPGTFQRVHTSSTDSSTDQVGVFYQQQRPQMPQRPTTISVEVTAAQLPLPEKAADDDNDDNRSISGGASRNNLQQGQSETMC